ncbi:protein Churchill isoform 3-T3 [Spheniscus humboldti]
MCGGCVGTGYPERGTTCLEGGSFLLNFVGPVQELPPPDRAPRVHLQRSGRLPGLVAIEDRVPAPARVSLRENWAVADTAAAAPRLLSHRRSTPCCACFAAGPRTPSASCPTTPAR